jgi:Tol biopolymer transport system component/DNA-binding winged helix-turn-helix (wHTH) protein
LQLIRPDTSITFISYRILLMALDFSVTPPTLKRIQFEGFEADLHTQELFKSGRKVRLSHQCFSVLAMLLERAGQLVTREELHARLWPAGTLVDYDQGLNAVINRLREALRDSAEAPRFIETLPKRGYRFIAGIHSENVPPPPASEAVTRKKFPTAAAIGLAAILLIVVTIVVISRRPEARLPLSREVVPFTSLPGQEIAPTFSPDGSQIAFAWNGETGADDQFDLYVKSLASERLVRLTRRASGRIIPAWSPDGSAIAFVRGTKESWGISVIPAVGGSERSIVSSGVAVGPSVQVSWSPDGRELAYSAYGPTGEPRVYFASLSSLDTRPLSPAAKCLAALAPAFSPDGKQLAWVCVLSSAVYGIDVMELPHGPVRSLAKMLGDPGGLVWSSDGSQLIFSNDSGDGGQLYQVTLGGKLSRLPFGEDGSAPALASRGGRMAYVHARRSVDIWRADLTAAQPNQTAIKLIESTRAQILPRYSSDGARIAFQSNRSGTTEIWMTDAQGGDPERLTTFNGPFTNAPSWCSDGHRIAFDSRASGLSAIYVADISARVPRQISASRSNLSSPAWSEDCRWLFATDGNGVLYRFPSSGGHAERFTQHSSTYAVVVADRVVFNVLDSHGVSLWTKPVNGGPEGLIENLPKLSYADVWTATAAGIYFTDAASKTISVNFYDYASKSTRTLMSLRQDPIPGGGGPGIAVSPDGRYLLYVEVDDEQSDIMLAPAP